MTKHIITSALILSCLLSPAMANDEMKIPLDNRIKVLTYDESDIYTINTKYGFQTSIVFARNEEVSTISVGDRSLWQIIPNGNRIFIRPMVDDVKTNMTVITNMREYHFDIQSLSEGKNNIVYVAHFRYPNEQGHEDETLNDMELPKASPVAASAPTVASPVILSPTPSLDSNGVTIPNLDTQRTQKLNTLYTYTGPDAIAPIQVYDDGRMTYVRYETMPSPAPKPYIVTPSGETVLANHSVSGKQIVIKDVSERFVLKHREGDIQVYNEHSKGE